MLLLNRKLGLGLIIFTGVFFAALFLMTQKADAASTAYGWARPAGNLGYSCPWPSGAVEFYLHDANGGFISGGNITVNGHSGGNPFLYPFCTDTYGGWNVSASRTGYRNFYSEFQMIDSVAAAGRGTGTRVNIYLSPSSINAPSVHITSPGNGTTTSSSSLTFSVYNRRLPAFGSNGVLEQHWKRNGGWQGIIGSNFPYGSRNFNVPLVCGNNNIGFSHNEQNSLAVSAVADITVTRNCSPPPQPDLVIRNTSNTTSPQINGPTTRNCGESGTYQFRTRNIGAATAGSSTSQAFSIGSSNQSDIYSIGSLGSSSSSGILSYTTSWSTAGTKTVWVGADYGNAISEANESNNAVYLEVEVTCVVDEELDVVVFVDRDGDGFKDSGEQFASSGNPSFNSSVATINENSSNNSPPIQNITSQIPTNGIKIWLNKTANKTYQYQVVPQGDWELTKWRANRSTSSCAANTSCNYNSGWTGQLTLQVGQPVAFYLGVVPPDLVIRNSSNGTSPPIDGPTTVPCNASATYYARTRNIGRATSSSSVTQATAPGSTNNSDNFSVGPLGFNTSSSVHSFTTSWTSAGTKTVSFVADNNGNIIESNEANNAASITVTVTACVVPEPDLVIRNSTNGTSPPIDGSTTVNCNEFNQYSARTRNIGDATASSSVTVSVTSGASDNSDSYSVGFLSPNTSSPVHYFYTSWASAGVKTLTFTADSNGSVAESNEGNNSASINITVVCAPSNPDLVIRNSSSGTSPSVDGPTTVSCGQSATYMARTRNIGNASAGSSTTTASTTGSSNDNDEFSVPSLSSSTSSSIHFFTTSWSTSGTRTVTFRADAYTNVAESNESNNTASISVSVSNCSTPMPDLVIRNSTGGTSPSIDGPTNVQCGAASTYTARTRNIGDASAGSSITRASTSVSTNDSDNFSVGSLSINASSSVHFYTTSWNTAGTRTVTFAADVGSAVSESNESNNTASITVTVDCSSPVGPNLSVLVMTPAAGSTLEVGEDINFEAIIQNVGTEAADKSLARFCWNNSSGCYTNTINQIGSDVTTPYISAGNAAYVITTGPWTPSSTGTYRITLCADVPGPGVVFESDESDNCLSINVPIGAVSAPDPWFETTGGDVGSKGSINNIADNHWTPPGHNADYLVVSSGGIDTDFRSRLGWWINGYSGLNIEPEPLGASQNDIYTALRNRKPPCGTISGVGAATIRLALIANPGCRVFEYNGVDPSYIINNSTNYNLVGDVPIILYVPSNPLNGGVGIRVGGNNSIGSNTGIIFVAQDDISVQSSATDIDGVFITNGTFYSRGTSCNISGGGDSRLRIEGAVYAFTEVCLTRNLGNNNSSTSAEVIEYEPKYLFLFPDLTGGSKIIYREVAP